MAPSIHLGRRARLALKIGGFVVLGLVSFLFALQLTFDYDRVVQKYFVEPLAGSYVVKVTEIDRGIMPGTFTLKRVRLMPRPTKADEVQQELVIDRIDADVGVLALVGGKLSVDFDAQLGGGTLTGSVAMPFRGGGLALSAAGHGVRGDAIPQLRQVIGGLPLLGKLDVGVSVSVGTDWRKATGTVTLGCPKGCTLGDGQTKFKPLVKNQRSQVMVGEGIEWGRVQIDRLAAKAELKDGRFKVTKWELDSKDAELHVELDVKLAKRFKDLEFTVGCFRYRALPALQERDAKTAAAIATVGGILGPDELFHVKLEGTWATVKPRPKTCSGDAPADDGKGRGPALTAPEPTAPRPVDTSGVQPGADIAPTPAPPIDAAPIVDAAPAAPATAGSGAGSAAIPGGIPGAAPGAAAPAPGQPGEPPRELREAPPEPPVEQPPPVAPKENE